MKGLPKMVLSVEDGDMESKLQDIRGIVKQRGESGRLKTIILPTHPTLARRDALVPSKAAGEK
jgi:hypothetical protein